MTTHRLHPTATDFLQPACPCRLPKLLSLAMLTAMLLPALAVCRAEQFTAPTKEELAMTSLPGYPGVAAVVLFREELTRDDLHVVQHYDRIKVLTEEGKKYANVELGYVSTSGDYEWSGDDKTLGSIAGRTIHPDGTIIPFTGKPYKKTYVKTGNAKYQAMIFTLPDVEVGSIIEYRYDTRISDNMYEAPDWIIQGELYVKSAHYAWYPTIHDLVDNKQRSIDSISWFPILPPDAKIERREMPAAGFANAPQHVYELTVKDVPPQVKEEYMPPIANYSYRVLFNFSPYRSGDEYWKSEGKDWSKRTNSFEKPNSDLTKATDAIIAGAATPDAKLRKIYASVMALENSDYTREHGAREDKANGLGKLNDADDVLKHKRGDSTQLAKLFVSMARAAGLPADLMLVPDRSRNLFMSGWLTFSQFDDAIAIVNIDGKDQFFDPGSRDCPYGQLAWEHTFLQGLRQKGDEAIFTDTPGSNYLANKTIRVANLNMDSNGQITGKIDLTFVGATALRWRQDALRGDQESVKHGLRTHLEDMIPKSFEVKDVAISNLDDYEQPLKVTYTIAGTMGTRAGKRLLMPADLFLANDQAVFTQEKRQLAVYFHYPETVQDALRINFPTGFSIEATPSDSKFNLPKEAVYDMTVAAAPTNFTTRRIMVFNDIFILAADYTPLRSFYSQFEANDQQSVVLKLSPQTTATATSKPAN
jgi:hypothetical protein